MGPIMNSHHRSSAHRRDPDISLVTGSFRGQLYAGSQAKLDNLGGLHAFLTLNRRPLPTGMLTLVGQTKAFTRFTRGIKECSAIAIGADTDIAPDGGIKSLKSHLLALGLVSSDTTISMALDLGSAHVQLCYREWVSAGAIPILVMNLDTHKPRLLMTPIQGIEAEFKDLPGPHAWEPNAQKRMLQVFQAIEAISDWNDTVFLSVSEWQDPEEQESVALPTTSDYLTHIPANVNRGLRRNIQA